MEMATALTTAEERLVARALQVLQKHLTYGDRPVMKSPAEVRAFLRLRLGDVPHEEFHVLYLDSQNKLIEAEAMFRGTLTQTSVYPREVAKGALLKNAAGVIVAHNHPSGIAEPSAADRLLTNALKSALALLDVPVLDHIIVTSERCFSFAEAGLL